MEKIMQMLENEKSNFSLVGINIRLNRESGFEWFDYLECYIKNHLETNMTNDEIIDQFRLHLSPINSELRLLLAREVELKKEILDSLEQKIKLYNLSLDEEFKRRGHRRIEIVGCY